MKLDELGLRDVVGDVGASALKQIGNRILGRPTGGMSILDRATQEKFIQNFISKASMALQQAIESGRVDPNFSSLSNTTPTQTASQASTQPAPANAKVGAAAAKGYQAQKATTQNINSYIQKAAKTLNTTPNKSQKIALTKELVNFMADRKNYPEWRNALTTVQQVIKKGGLDPNFSDAAISKLTTGQRIAEAWQINYINKLLESVNLSWDDLGLAILKESKTNNFVISELKFLRLNNIFESIMLDEQAISISDFMGQWIAKYAGKNVDFSDPSIAGTLKSLLNSLQSNYTKDKGKDALIKIGKLIQAEMSSGAEVPQGGRSAATPTQAQTSFTGSTGQNKVTQLVNIINNLSPQEKAQISQAIK